MKKRIFSMVMAVLMLFTFNIGAYAESTVQPRYSYTNSVLARLSVESQQAVCTGIIDCNSSVTKVTVKIILQKKGVFKWNNVTTWTDEVNGDNYSRSYRYGPVDSGKYRVKVEATVYAGTASENVSATSSTVTV
ncbi:MAG: hypothetical protein IJ946_05955 [Clostridia bacterium]|nr:hypothetical protein [Clostridia bacterium]